MLRSSSPSMAGEDKFRWTGNKTKICSFSSNQYKKLTLPFIPGTNKPTEPLFGLLGGLSKTDKVVSVIPYPCIILVRQGNLDCSYIVRI